MNSDYLNLERERLREGRQLSHSNKKGYEERTLNLLFKRTSMEYYRRTLRAKVPKSGWKPFLLLPGWMTSDELTTMSLSLPICTVSEGYHEH